MTSDHAGQPWRARQREILSRIVRETEAPTDSLPLIKHPERRQPDDYYDARLGEVLDLAVSVGAVLMASGTPATAVIDQVIGHRRRIRDRALRGRRHQHGHPRRRISRADLTAGQHAAYRAVPVNRLQPTGGRRPPHPPHPYAAGIAVGSTRRACRDHHRAAPVQALDRDPGLGCAGIRYRGDPRRGATRLFGQRGEHHGDRPRQSATQ